MKATQEQFFILVIIMLISGVVYLLGPVLTPFLIGLLLAYLANPLVTKLIDFKIPRLASVLMVFVLVFIGITALLLMLIPFVEKQINLFFQAIPAIINWLKEFTQNNIAIDTETVRSFLIDNWSKAGGIANTFIKSALHSWGRVFEWIMNLLLIPVVTFYLLCDWDALINSLRNLLPRRIEPTVVSLITECDEVLSEFLRGQLLVMMSLAAIYSVGLSILGVQMGLLIGLVSGLLSIIPYLGFVVGIVVASITAYFQFQQLSAVLLVVAVFIFGQTIDHILLTPRLVGNRIGLHPVAVIFSILAGGCLFGFIGALLALPVAAVIMVWVHYLHQSYHSSKFYRS